MWSQLWLPLQSPPSALSSSSFAKTCSGNDNVENPLQLSCRLRRTVPSEVRSR
jgi:hypothetical protein